MFISEKVQKALEENKPIVALESTVIAHGLPYPENLKVAQEFEDIVYENGCVPATIGILKGKVIVGLSKEQLIELVDDNPIKVGTREISYAIAMKKSAATTVSSTAKIASLAGIKVFATGGIGGVHRGEWDVSQDIIELSKTNIIVVSAGCKSILDIKKTLEFLETFQVLTVGYKTEYFPIFYNRLSKEKIYKVENADEIANIFNEKNKLKLESAILVANPIPEDYVLDNNEIEGYIKTIEKEIAEKDIHGKEVTPYMLKRLVELSNGKTLESNIVLLKNNVELACKIAQSLKK
ncbi:indigoidine synthase A like protein [Thermosipho africanus TCF52B]|uniref:Pseudouridine-5'-phosphate glycosidase n=1 Tax=Thermosipho africanus (strain TCF52B) TaxID=484019 RepID=PSUG_THEAB|nr:MULTISPECIES: pseudouridine-5'-phosphate glycosidase [Thermosipho]B7ID34.1 RecName: Full=Pseudouridine-5'-phosphate glycosidase; Short=PsiMP glycosidase [Thermosipho africanus TCF52B]ACJ75911.1 indigoidine synthase A like protein [Thermosipho africanus TCF52B]MBZ4650259.1 indigoidine synthase like protein [Thermosipho sp. (in: thermotogales)]MDK2838899.1 pseudouridylate synthase [Thermosipho sp. (in: thermotogales)]MDK2900854.1 pseudouridylate synthase [Thermosipho sp. (in: thermotogales)]